jgi:hypothetical protein
MSAKRFGLLQDDAMQDVRKAEGPHNIGDQPGFTIATVQVNPRLANTQSDQSGLIRLIESY